MRTKNYVKGYSLQLYWWPKGRLTVCHFALCVYLPIFFKNVKFGVKGECDLYCLEIRSVLNSPTKGNTKQP